MPSRRLLSPRSRLSGSRTALKPAYNKARLMMSFKAECRGKRSALRRHERECRPYLSTMVPQRNLCGAQTGRPRRWLIAIRNDSFSSKVPIAVDGRQFIHAPELGCVSEERHASRCWSSRSLKVAEREDDLMSSQWRWRFGFSGSDGLVDVHTSKRESRARGMLSGRVISDIKDWLNMREVLNLRRDANLCRPV